MFAFDMAFDIAFDMPFDILDILDNLDILDMLNMCRYAQMLCFFLNILDIFFTEESDVFSMLLLFFILQDINYLHILVVSLINPNQALSMFPVFFPYISPLRASCVLATSFPCQSITCKIVRCFII